jgi:hypothetical protein
MFCVYLFSSFAAYNFTLKKFLAIMFTVFYFGFSSGMAYNVHYCLDQIFISTSASDNTCNLCGTKGKKECCKSEIKILKTDVGQKANVSFLNKVPLVAVFPEVFYAVFAMPTAERNQFSVQGNAPPDKAELPLFISYCNFRL